MKKNQIAEAISGQVASTYAQAEAVHSILISVINDKGGVGKTTFVIELGYKLAAAGYKVLILDLDLQSNCTSFYCPDKNAVKGVETIFSEEPTLSYVQAQVLGEAVDNLFISPSNDNLPGALHAASVKPGADSCLLEAIKYSQAGFHYILADCPPNPESLQKHNAARASDVIITPYITDINSVNGISGIIKSIARINEKEPVIRAPQNQYQKARKSLNRQTVDWAAALNSNTEELQATSTRLKKFTFVLDDIKIPTAAIAADAHSNGYPLDIAAPKCSTNIALHEYTNMIIESTQP